MDINANIVAILALIDSGIPDDDDYDGMSELVEAHQACSMEPTQALAYLLGQVDSDELDGWPAALRSLVERYASRELPEGMWDRAADSLIVEQYGAGALALCNALPEVRATVEDDLHNAIIRRVNRNLHDGTDIPPSPSVATVRRQDVASGRAMAPVELLRSLTPSGSFDGAAARAFFLACFEGGYTIVSEGQRLCAYYSSGSRVADVAPITRPRMLAVDFRRLGAALGKPSTVANPEGVWYWTTRG